MSRLGIILAGAFVVSVPFASQAQQQTIKRDPEAIRILAASFVAMGGANLVAVRDTEIRAQVTMPSSTGNAVSSIVIRTLGSRSLRVESDLTDGAGVFLIDEGRAFLQSGADASIYIPRRSVAGAGLIHLPVFSILSEWADGNISVEYLGVRTEGGTGMHHIRMARRLRPEEGLGDFDPTSELFIDSQSLLPVRLTYSLRAPENLRRTVPIEIRYSNYRVVSSVAVPHLVSQFVRGQLLSELRVLSFAVNQGAQARDFQVR